MSTKKITSSDKNNQLTHPSEFDPKKMMFSEPIDGTVPDTPIKFKRVQISVLNKDGSVGDLIIPTTRLFSFGVSENVSQETKKVNGYSLPICMWNKNGASEEEKLWTDTLDKVVSECKKYLIRNKEELEKPDLVETDLRNLNPLYFKREKGKIVEGRGPTLYVKLIESKKQNKILSIFRDTQGNVVEPLSFLKKYCFVKAAVKIESIFIGSKITLQIKLYEAADVESMDAGIKPLMKPSSNKRVEGLLTGSSTNMNDMEDENDFKQISPDNKVETGSIDGEEEQPPKSPPKVVRKVIKPAAKKPPVKK